MKIWRWSWPFLVLIHVLAGCSARGKLIRSLPPEDQQFLSEVRYIITNQEKKLFPTLGTAERKQFIEDFWKKRDPSPSTDENEFRDQYYGRIDKANRLFREGSSGWLTDRGRVLILLGDPERRNVYPSGYTFYDRPMEIWYYHLFTIVFVDYTFTGVYKLEPQSVQQLGMITSTQMSLKPEGLSFLQVVFDFGLQVEKSGANEATLVVSVPYETLNMAQKPGQTSAIETTLKIDVLVSADKGETVLQKQETKAVSLAPEELGTLAKNLDIRLPLTLAPGKYSALVTLENATDNSKVSKKVDFSL